MKQENGSGMICRLCLATQRHCCSRPIFLIFLALRRFVPKRFQPRHARASGTVDVAECNICPTSSINSSGDGGRIHRGGA